MIHVVRLVFNNPDGSKSGSRIVNINGEDKLISLIQKINMEQSVDIECLGPVLPLPGWLQTYIDENTP